MPHREHTTVKTVQATSPHRVVHGAAHQKVRRTLFLPHFPWRALSLTRYEHKKAANPRAGGFCETLVLRS
jgi:hypothetical protein